MMGPDLSHPRSGDEKQIKLELLEVEGKCVVRSVAFIVCTIALLLIDALANQTFVGDHPFGQLPP